MSEAQAQSGELIDLKTARSNRSKRGPAVSRQSLDVDGDDLPQSLDDLQWPVVSLNKAIRDVEDRITRELRNGITSHDPGPILRDLRTEVTQVRSRLDELNERIEQICASPAPRPERERTAPPKDIGALETLLAALAEKIDSAIVQGGRGADVVETIDESEMLEARPLTTTAASAPKDATFERRAAAMYSQRLHAEIDVAGGSAVFSSESTTVEAHAHEGRVTWNASKRPGAEATQRVFLSLAEAARWTKGRAAAEAKWVQAPKLFEPSSWASQAPQQLLPGQGGKRDRVVGLAPFARASVFGLTGLIFVFCGYALSRPADTGSGVGSTGVAAGEASRLGVGVSPENTVDSAMASLLRSRAVAGAQMTGSPPLQSALSLVPPVKDEAGTPRDPVAQALHPTSAPSADPNMSEAEIQALAEKGDARAQYELATRLLMRQEKGANAKLALDWLEKAARQDFALAQLRLGILYGKGVGVNRDYALARKWFQAAAENGNALAMHNLAVLLGEGHGRKPDASAAIVWRRKAAELGVVDSQYNLGLDYMQGVGVERDLVQSYAWFATAAAGGDAKASKKRKEIAALLDPEELESARALASRLKQKQVSTTQADD